MDIFGKNTLKSVLLLVYKAVLYELNTVLELDLFERNTESNEF